MLRNLDWLHQPDIVYDCSTFDTDPFEPQPDSAGTIFPFVEQDSTLYLLHQEGSNIRVVDVSLVDLHPLLEGGLDPRSPFQQGCELSLTAALRDNTDDTDQ